MISPEDELSPEEDAEFAALPEPLRLALLIDARGKLCPLDPLSCREISRGAGVPVSRIERTLRIAVLKLRKANRNSDL